MSTSSDSAEEIVRLSLEGFEVFAKLSGSMAKNLAVMLYTMSKDKGKRTKGRTRLTNMLKSSSNLSIFSIKKEDFNDFKKQARRYGILYCALYNKNQKTTDGLVDLIIKEEDSGRVNRVVERYNITKVDIEKVEKELDTIDATEEKTENKNNTQRVEINKDIQAKNTSDDVVNALLKRRNIKEENENTNPSNLSGSEKNYPLGNSLKTNEKSEETKIEEKSSIREQIETIAKRKEEEKAKIKEDPKEISKQAKTNETKHKQPKKIDKKRREKKNEFI